MAKRYYVSPSDTCGSVENAVRDRQWDVIDRNTGHCIANYDRREDARKEAHERNQEKPQ